VPKQSLTNERKRTKKNSHNTRQKGTFAYSEKQKKSWAWKGQSNTGLREKKGTAIKYKEGGSQITPGDITGNIRTPVL